MISRKEIESKAQEFEIQPTNVEKDYIFGWLLFGLFTVSNLRDRLFLKGGNALRKGYFEQTRFSADLDLGIPNDIRQESLLQELNAICSFIQEKTGVQFLTSDNKIEEKFVGSDSPLPDLKVYEVRVYFKDFFGMGDHVRLKIVMDVTRFDKVILPLQVVKLIHPYSDASDISCNIRCMKLEEIIATKLKCLMQRQHTADLFDYAYSIKLLGGTLNKKEVAEVLVRKTIFQKNPHVLKNILLKTPFEYFKDYWVRTVVCAKAIIFGVEEAISIFLADIETLFNIYPKNSFAQFAFFGPELRLPIMEAGRKQTLLKIRYNHEDRLVEPYSLKYMLRRDGAQREYLYVYNLLGGSSPPGQRSLVAENFQSIEVTDQKFIPRYVIELSKAGELPEDRFLFDPNKPAKRTKSRASKVRRIKYLYQCTACGKKFSKTKSSSILGAHKNKNGFRCGSRRGIYLGTKY
jgi:predicted nucleotidyltransferase component of viral defense system